MSSNSNSPPLSHFLMASTSMSAREHYKPRRLGIRANLPHAKTCQNRGSRGPFGSHLAKQTTVGPAKQTRNSSAATTPCRPEFSRSSASFPDDKRLSPTSFSLLLDQLTRAGPRPSPRAPGRPRHGTSPCVVRHGSCWLYDALVRARTSTRLHNAIPTTQYCAVVSPLALLPSTSIDPSPYLPVQNSK